MVVVCARLLIDAVRGILWLGFQAWIQYYCHILQKIIMIYVDDFFKSHQMNIHAFNCFQLFKKQKLYRKGYIFDMRGKRELMHVKMLNVVVLLKKYSRTCLFSKSATTKPF